MIRTIFAIAVVALGFTAVPGTSQARGVAANSAGVTKVSSQQAHPYGGRCWWRGGVRVCN